MSREFIDKRLREYNMKRDAIERQERLEQQALHSAPKMFSELKLAVKRHIDGYNQAFREVPDSACQFVDEHGSFEVRRPAKSRSLIVTFKQQAGMILFHVSETAGPGFPDKNSAEGTIEVKPDPADGTVYFNHEKTKMRSVDEVIELLLDHIISGPRDFD